MELNKCHLQEHEPLGHLLSVLPLKAQKGLSSIPIDYTCLDVTPEFIALGTNVGLVLLYDRLAQTLQRLNCKIKTEVITCIRMAESVDYVLAAGTRSGKMFVFQLPSLLPGRAKQMQMYYVADVHFAKVTCVEWSQNTLKLFSGDELGSVACTEMDYGQHQSKSYVIAEEPHEVIQLDYSHKTLLISTMFRSILCTPGNTSAKQRLGKKDRKILGPFGACFKPELCRPEDATIYAARPGLRLWKANTEGNVLATYMYKDLLGGSTPLLVLLPDSTRDQPAAVIEEKTFGILKVFAGNLLVTWHQGTVFVLDPEKGSFVGWHAHLGNIKGLSVCHDEIFILRDEPGLRKVMRIAQKRDLLNETVQLKHSGLPAASVNHPPPSPVHLIQQTASSLAGVIFGEKSKTVQEGQAPPWGSVVDPTALPSPDLDSCKEVTSHSSGGSSTPSPEKQVATGQPTIVLDSPDTITVTIEHQASEVTPHSASSESGSAVETQNPTGPSVRLSSSDSFPPPENKADRLAFFSSISNDDDQIVFSSTTPKTRKGKKKRVKPAEKEKDRDRDVESISSFESPFGRSTSGNTSQDLPSAEEPEQVNAALLVASTSSSSHNGQNKKPESQDLSANDILSGQTCQLTTAEAEEGPGNTPNVTERSAEQEVTAILDHSKERDISKNSAEQSTSIDKPVEDNEAVQPAALASTSTADAAVHTAMEGAENSAGSLPNDNSSNQKSENIQSVKQMSSSSVFDTPNKGSQLYASSDSSTDDFYSRFKRSSSIVSPSWSPDDEPTIEEALERGSVPNTADDAKKNPRSSGRLGDSWTEFLAPGNLVSICLTYRHIWCVDKSERLHYSGLSGPGLKWRKVDEPAKMISVSRSGWIVWRLHNSSAFAGTAITARAPAGMKWVEAARDVAHICVDNTEAWYIKNNGDVFVQKSISRERPCYRATPVSGHARLLLLAVQDGVVWGVTEARNIVVRTGVTAGTEEGTDWKPVGKEGSDLVVSSLAFGDNGTAWVVDVVGRLWFTTGISWDNPCGTGTWWQVSLSDYLMEDYRAIDALKSLAAFPQNLAKIVAKEKGGLVAVGSNGIWVCPGNKHVLHVCRGGLTGHRFNTVVPSGLAASAQWHSICAGAVTDNDGLIWAQQPNNAIFYFASHNKKFCEVSPPETGSPFVCLSSTRHALWGLLGDGRVVVRGGISAHCPQGINWLKLDLTQLGSARMVFLSCGTEGVWGVDNRGIVYLRIGVKAPERRHPGALNPAWVPIDGTPHGAGAKFNKVFAGPSDWMVWALDNKKQVYVRKGVSDSMPIGTHWSHIQGTTAEQLCLSERYVYALNAAGEVLMRYGVVHDNPGGNYWKKVPGALKQMTVTTQDELWGINPDGQLCQRSVYYQQRQDVLEELGDQPSSRDNIGDDWELI